MEEENLQDSDLKNINSQSELSQDQSSLKNKSRIIFALLALANFSIGIVYSLPSPFYPYEAELKGVTPANYGVILGIYELANVIVATLIGSNMSRFGPVKIFNLGLFFMGLMSMAFGCLHFVSGITYFILGSYFVRILQAVGYSFAITASSTIIVSQFPKSTATTFASMESLFGVGAALGPSFAGLLLEAGGDDYGYPLAFIALGAFQMSVVPVILYFLWNLAFSNQEPSPSLTNQNVKSGLISLLKIRKMYIYLFGVFAVSYSLGFLSTLLEPHLRQFGLRPSMMGFVYSVYLITYAVTSPLWGTLCDKYIDPNSVTLFGSIFMLIALTIIGPVSFIPLQTTLYLIVPGLVFFGLGLGSSFISTFVLSHKTAKENGFENNLGTNAIVSGVWRSFLALGSFIGPSISGLLYNDLGFQKESLIPFTLDLLLIVLILYTIALTHHNFSSIFNKKSNIDDETTPLLRN